MRVCVCVLSECKCECVCVTTRGQLKEAGKAGSQQSSNSELRLSGLLTNVFTS